MSILLTRIPAGASCSDFARSFRDDDFNGIATKTELTQFCSAASAAATRDKKDRDRQYVLTTMGRFAELPASTTFPHLNSKIVMYQMILRLMKPERVNQKEFGICGPAHFVVILIKSKPDKYVNMAYELLKDGRTYGDGVEIVPDKYVANYDPEGTMPQADWLLAATLRNADTEIPLGKKAAYKGTNSTQVFAYFVNAGYREVVALPCHTGVESALAFFVLPALFKPTSLQAELERIAGSTDIQSPANNLRLAAHLRTAGYRVMIRMNEDLLKLIPVPGTFAQAADPNDPSHRSSLNFVENKWKPLVSKKHAGLFQNASHWVVIKKLDIINDQVSFVVYTWGSRRQTNDSIPLSDFVNAYAGFVAARG